RLIQFPVGIFGVAMGMAVLPMLSEHATKGDIESMREDISFSLRLLFFITVPSMAGLIALREPIVNLLFQRGVFDYNATRGTSDALLFYSIGIWAIVGVRVMTSSFYSLHDTKTPVKVAVLAMTTNIIFSIIFMRFMKHSGLAFANSIASVLNLTLLSLLLRKRLGRIDGKRIVKSLLKTTIASLSMALMGWFIIRSDIWKVSGMAAVKSLYLGGTIALCLMIYIMVCLVLKSDEIRYVYNMIRNR
ncbi:MAG: murein biosynthesis integral membrane protein MurJ, partial [Thermodesulfovibrionales bacterium]